MLTLTQEAADAIRRLSESPTTDGVRLHAGGRRFGRPVGEIQVELAECPDVEDTVLEADGARLYLEPDSMRELDDKVLDADEVDGEIRFALFEQPDA